MTLNADIQWQSTFTRVHRCMTKLREIEYALQQINDGLMELIDQLFDPDLQDSKPSNCIEPIEGRRQDA